MITTPEAYRDAMLNKQRDSVRGLAGRFLKARPNTPDNPTQTEDDFKYLSYDRTRPIVFLFEEKGLQDLLKMKTMEIMEFGTGYTPGEIDKYIREGWEFGFVVFPEQSAKPAYWKEVFRFAIPNYPKIRDLLILTRVCVQNTPCIGSISHEANFQRILGLNVTFQDVYDKGDTHPQYMTEDILVQMYQDRWINNPHQTFDDQLLLAASVRLWLLLKFRLNQQYALKELYADGAYTYGQDGKRLAKEFFYPNIEIKTIQNNIFYRLTV